MKIPYCIAERRVWAGLSTFELSVRAVLPPDVGAQVEFALVSAEADGPRVRARHAVPVSLALSVAEIVQHVVSETAARIELAPEPSAADGVLSEGLVSVTSNGYARVYSTRNAEAQVFVLIERGDTAKGRCDVLAMLPFARALELRAAIEDVAHVALAFRRLELPRGPDLGGLAVAT